LPLLARHVVIRQIQLTGPAANLQRLKDGRANWEFTLPESGEPSPWVMDIDQIGFDQGQVKYQDEVLRADLTAQIDPLGKPIPFAALAGRPAEDGDAPDRAADRQARGEAAGGEPAKEHLEGQAAKEPPADGQAPAAPPDYVFGWNIKGRYQGMPAKGEGKI